MENTEILSEIPSLELIAELERRYPTGLAVAFITDDPSFNKDGFTEYFKITGSQSAMRGLTENLADYAEMSNGRTSTSYRYSDVKGESLDNFLDKLNDMDGWDDDDFDDDEDDDEPWR